MNLVTNKYFVIGFLNGVLKVEFKPDEQMWSGNTEIAIFIGLHVYSYGNSIAPPSVVTLLYWDKTYDNMCEVNHSAVNYEYWQMTTRQNAVQLIYDTIIDDTSAQAQLDFVALLITEF